MSGTAVSNTKYDTALLNGNTPALRDGATQAHHRELIAKAQPSGMTRPAAAATYA
jgi:hypothetical protein